MKRTDDYDWAEDVIASYALAIQMLRERILRIGYQVKVRRNGSRDEPFITLRFSR